MDLSKMTQIEIPSCDDDNSYLLSLIYVTVGNTYVSIYKSEKSVTCDSDTFSSDVNMITVIILRWNCCLLHLIRI